MDPNVQTDVARRRARFRPAWFGLAAGLALIGTVCGLGEFGARRLRYLSATVAELERMGISVHSWEPTTWALVRSKLRGDRVIGLRSPGGADGIVEGLSRPVVFWSKEIAPERLAIVRDRLARFGRVTRFDRPGGHWWSVTPRYEAMLRRDLPDATVVADPVSRSP